MFDQRTLRPAPARAGWGGLGRHKLRRRISLQMHSAVKTGTAASELGEWCAGWCSSETVKLLQPQSERACSVCLSCSAAGVLRTTEQVHPILTTHRDIMKDTPTLRRVFLPLDRGGQC